MPHHIELLKARCRIKPMVNQLKLCPGVVQKEVVDYCAANGILVQAYSPFGTGSIFRVPQMQACWRTKYPQNHRADLPALVVADGLAALAQISQSPPHGRKPAPV